eukprot:TRINITY_DN15512_c0_g1_i1.p1 TRINITY_DN15512_c0_g1~~TRINITY_DN15512_c0_g1_i1.p1  ORF type:complete len:360 (-),score=74.85 TRINITY_DN15512_c0_g1_i1:341-1420(-)
MCERTIAKEKHEKSQNQIASFEHKIQEFSKSFSNFSGVIVASTNQLEKKIATNASALKKALIKERENNTLLKIQILDLGNQTNTSFLQNEAIANLQCKIDEYKKEFLDLQVRANRFEKENKELKTQFKSSSHPLQCTIEYVEELTVKAKETNKPIRKGKLIPRENEDIPEISNQDEEDIIVEHSAKPPSSLESTRKAESELEGHRIYDECEKLKQMLLAYTKHLSEIRAILFPTMTISEMGEGNFTLEEDLLRVKSVMSSNMTLGEDNKKLAKELESLQTECNKLKTKCEGEVLKKDEGLPKSRNNSSTEDYSKLQVVLSRNIEEQTELITNLRAELDCRVLDLSDLPTEQKSKIQKIV